MDKKLTLAQRYSKLRSGFKIVICFVLIMMVLILYEVVTYGHHNLAQYVQEIAFIVIPIILWKYVEKKPLEMLGFSKGKRSVLTLIVGLVCGAAAISIVLVILLFSKNAIFVGSILKPNFTAGTFNGLILFILVGFAEETFFRGYCLRSISEKNKKIIAAVIASIIFSLLHGLNPNVGVLFFMNVFLIGMLFAYMTFKFNIWLPIGFHIMWDYFESNVWGFADSGIVIKGIYNIKVPVNNIINGGLVGPEGGLAVTFTVLLGFFIIFMIKRKDTAN
ncbi:CPBP family intramembrane metalloprotease [Clostridium felsineum]|uniref:CPBP family intramembrane glutamic endopeptidase n=1 Tax=Clostridium felsineum TaxID=36839 RepID=UPI00214D55D0|nr:type II CAAX endopeptidase family protein [Clostridium felsineum]MCR3759579.1 CPBP family intramembrane metalloprotease [Clostridium felsineum]